MATMDGPFNFRGLDKSVRIQKIIDTAADIFHKKGYRSTTLDDVSKKLGITKAAIYHYVASKEEILSTIYMQALQNIFMNTSSIVEKRLAPNEKLRLIIRNHIKNIIRPIAMMCVFFDEENQLPEKILRKIREEKNRYNLMLEKVIEEGISQGLFIKSDPKLQSFAMIGMCNWVYKWYKPGPGSYTPDQIADHFVSLLERGYLKGDTQGMTNMVKPATKKEP